jgi:hypothetical protein
VLHIATHVDLLLHCHGELPASRGGQRGMDWVSRALCSLHGASNRRGLGGIEGIPLVTAASPVSRRCSEEKEGRGSGGSYCESAKRHGTWVEAEGNFRDVWKRCARELPARVGSGACG